MRDLGLQLVLVERIWMQAHALEVALSFTKRNRSQSKGHGT